jgi:hypothetical protein
MASTVPRTLTIRPKKKQQQNSKSGRTVVSMDEKNEINNTMTAAETAETTTAATTTDSIPYCDMDLFRKQQIKRKLMVSFSKIKQGVDVKQFLTNELAKQTEGYCSIEGYICPKSISILSYSCGTLTGANIIFDIVAECFICFPNEHTTIKCVARTITHAGIRAGATQLIPGSLSPIEVFLSRDMNTKNSELFSRIEENDILTVEIIGRRFVLHDTHVTIIAMLIDAKSPNE